MDPDLFEKIVRESREMGAFRVVMCGDGEPTLHPHFERMLGLVTRLKMEPYLITNGLGVDESRAKFWASKRAHFRFSIHAGDQETWLRVHPSGNSKQFEDLSRTIKSLVRAGKPRISTMHVIQRANFRQAPQMVEHAHEMGVREILFRPVRVESDLSKVVLSSEEERELRRILKQCLLLAENYGIHTNLREYLHNNLYTRSGILRTEQLYSKIPCYVGWIYAEFDLDGTMVPCLNSEKVMGRAGQQRIREMWNSRPYWLFRRECRTMPQTGKLVNGCPCNACVMAKYNINIYNLLHIKSLKYSEA